MVEVKDNIEDNNPKSKYEILKAHTNVFYLASDARDDDLTEIQKRRGQRFAWKFK